MRPQPVRSATSSRERPQAICRATSAKGTSAHSHRVIARGTGAHGEQEGVATVQAMTRTMVLKLDFNFKNKCLNAAVALQFTGTAKPGTGRRRPRSAR